MSNTVSAAATGSTFAAPPTTRRGAVLIIDDPVLRVGRKTSRHRDVVDYIALNSEVSLLRQEGLLKTEHTQRKLNAGKSGTESTAPNAGISGNKGLADLIVREKLRAKIEAAVARLIDALDAIDPDLDLEPEVDHDELDAGEEDLADHEPSLGSLCSINSMDCAWTLGRTTLPGVGSQADWANTSCTDREETCEDEGSEHDGREPEVDSEPMLGWTEHVDQENAAVQICQGCNLGDAGDAEPWLGAAENHHDQRRWGQGDLRDVELVAYVADGGAR